MKKTLTIEIDNWSRCLLYGVLSKSIINDKTYSPEDIEKLEEIKNQLQACRAPESVCKSSEEE